MSNATTLADDWFLSHWMACGTRTGAACSCAALADAYHDASFMSDAHADLLAEQRAAALERCGITVAELELPILTALGFDGPTTEGTHIQWAVYQDIDCVGLYDDDAAAYEYAYDLAGELIEQGDLS
jgi:hypothetical protein